MQTSRSTVRPPSAARPSPHPPHPPPPPPLHARRSRRTARGGAGSLDRGAERLHAAEANIAAGGRGLACSRSEQWAAECDLRGMEATAAAAELEARARRERGKPLCACHSPPCSRSAATDPVRCHRQERIVRVTQTWRKRSAEDLMPEQCFQARDPPARACAGFARGRRPR